MKERIDVLLVQNGYFDSREKAKRAIMAGIVIVNNKRIEKAGELIKIDKDPEIRIKGEQLKYVSRGGLKLEKAVEVFNLDINDKLVLDIGASTGGFTDCALQNGAKFVYALDVGTNQLAYKLREDKRVKSLENTHVKDLGFEMLDGNMIDVIVMDVSFISIRKILPDLGRYLKEDGRLMALIKPQFEVGRENIAKGGIVKDFSKHLMAIEKVIESGLESGLYLEAIDVSPITGGKGNVEYISCFSLADKKIEIDLKKLIEKGKKIKKGSK